MLGSSEQAPPLEDIADGLVADVVTQMGQGTGQAVIALATIVLYHLHNHVFEFLVNSGSSKRFASLRAIEFVSGELAVPTEDCVGLNHMSNFFKGFLPQFLTDLG
jgi:hypothetical protein